MVHKICDMEQPLVSCITPTANREKYLPYCIGYFLSQDYPNKELILLDDGRKSYDYLIPDDPRIRYIYSAEKLGTIGTKRNLACEKANGEIIVQWDDDDYYAPDWISRQVEAQLTSGADLTGLNNVHYYQPLYDKHVAYINDEGPKFWLFGPTMAFKKSFWENHRFRDLQVGEDHDFVWNSGGTVHALGYFNGYISLLHAHNTSIKPVEDPKQKKLGEFWVDEGADRMDNEDTDGIANKSNQQEQQQANTDKYLSYPDIRKRK